MTEKSLNKSMISALKFFLEEKMLPFQSRGRRPSDALTQALLDRGLLSGDQVVEINKSGVNALRGETDKHIEGLVKRWDKRSNASEIISKLEPIAPEAFSYLAQHKHWPEYASIGRPASGVRFSRSPEESVGKVIESIDSSKRSIEDSIFKLKSRVDHLERILDGVVKIDAELCSLGVKRNSSIEDGDQ